MKIINYKGLLVMAVLMNMSCTFLRQTTGNLQEEDSYSEIYKSSSKSHINDKRKMKTIILDNNL